MGQLSGSLRDGAGAIVGSAFPQVISERSLRHFYCCIACLITLAATDRLPTFAANANRHRRQDAATSPDLKLRPWKASPSRKCACCAGKARIKGGENGDEAGGYRYLSPRETNADSSLLLGLIVYTIRMCSMNGMKPRMKLRPR